MKKSIVIGLVLSLFGWGALRALPSPQGKSETMPRRLVQLRSAVISRAIPTVRSRIGASAAAVLQYAGGCGRNCDLEAFLRGDLKARFTRLSDTEWRALAGLTLAESFVTCSEAAAVRLNQLIQGKNTLVTLITNLLDVSVSTTASLMDNIKP